MALTETPNGDLGANCPEFNLLATDQRSYGRKDLISAKAYLIMFICNHCPYVLAIEDRLIALGKELANQPFRAFAISSNDAIKYPIDSFPNMQKRAIEKGYPFPYLFDETQLVAKSFGAVCTPDFFLYDGTLKLRYRGRLDDSWKDASLVRHQDLKNAIERLLAGEDVPANQKSSMGCSIKWKPEMMTP
jgi:thiol-disulfide isomerase/thioredoxin